MATDTSDAIEKKRQEIFRSMTGSERVELLFQMSDEAKQITCDGIKARNPHMTQKEIHEQWLTLLYGPELTQKLLADV